jgi:hypothetical protein
VDPFERLRWVARRGAGGAGGAATVAAEAAPAFSALAGERGALLTSARRLLDFHPACGPLWWMCARVLAADDPELAASFAAAELEEDPTARQVAMELAARRPAVVVALAAPAEHAVDALVAAPPPEVRVVADHWSLRRLVAALATAGDGLDGGGVTPEVTGWAPEEVEEALAGADLALVDVLAAGPAGVVGPPPAALLARAAAGARVPLWAVGGTGRVLPEPLFELLLSRLASDPGGGELVRAVDVACYLGPAGAADPRAALAESDCPVPVELLRRAR